ncbi:MAG: hypothetical protein H6577_01190 [Lewinellaceae bacterium]|nr:hypothetical protein [Saprospiraceae bacterium]MCB9336719.1 hypothetical protein [Lewinellaceae bacterium]
MNAPSSNSSRFLHTGKLTLLLVLLFSLSAQGQNNSNVKWQEMGKNRNATFYQVQADFYQYWQGRTIEKGKGYKPFKRWEAYMEPRVYPSGNMTLTSSTYPNFKEWQENSASSFNNLLTPTGNWTSLGPFTTPIQNKTGRGRLNFLRFDPTNTNTMYVGAPDGGLWKSTNGGATWATNTDFLSVIGTSDLVIDPTNTQIMYLATGDIEGNKNSLGIFKSTDGGTTWNTTSLTFGFDNYYRISKLLMHPSNPMIMIAATSGGIFRTTDGWATNTAVVPCCSDDLKDMEFKPGDPNIVYAAGTEYYRSTDNGQTWNIIATGLPTSNVSRIALGVSPANPAYVYALYGKASDQSYLGLYRSTDSGATFSMMSSTPNLLGYETDGSDNGGQAFYDLSIAISPTNADLVTTGGVNHWRSTDGGVNWSILTHWFGDNGVPFVHADVHEITYMPGSSTNLFSCNDGGIYKSTDNGATWTEINNNLVIGQQTEIGLSQSTADLYVVGYQDNGTMLHSGAGWNSIFGGDGGDCFISYNSNDTVYFSYVNAEFHRSDDGGATETQITTGLSGSADFYSRWYLDPVNSSILYAAGRDSLFKSTNKGNTWTKLDAGFGSDHIKAIAVAPSNNSIVYTVKPDAVSKSTNGGVNLNANVTGTLPVANAALSDIIVSNTDPNKIWACFSGYSAGNKVFKSIDGGTTWTNISAGLPNVPMNSLVYTNGNANDAIYVGADIGVFYYDNTLAAWAPFFTSLPNVAVRDLEIYYPTGKLRAGTYGRGIWESDLYTPAEGCVPNLVVTQNPVPSGNYKSQGDLNSNSSTVLSGAIVNFISDTGVKLNYDFEVVLGGVFEAFIQSCTNVQAKDN